jgi:NADH:ubiquinone oxidoreductase subunit 5 (subunit L)/multisubunit Na+/H+ antiporter MnhA subunit
MDWLYDTFIVKPYAWMANVNRMDIVDWCYNFTADVIRLLHELTIQSQTGQLRTYAGVMVLGLATIVAIALFSGGGTAP